MDGIVFHPCPFWNPGVAGTFVTGSFKPSGLFPPALQK